ncbi:MAG: hypothetical protein QW568_00610 [Candidatus Anstonellaceae archaeon]
MLCTNAANRYSANIRQLPRAGWQCNALQAFFSLDAMLALAIAIFAFAAFSLLLSSAGAFAASQSKQASSESLALSFSSHILDNCAARPPYSSPDSYSKTNELDENCLHSIQMQDVLALSGTAFASISLYGAEGELFHSESGTKGAEVFCARRLASVSGKMSRLEVCLS